MIYSHKETFVTLDEMGRNYPNYQPTFDFGQLYINSSHEFYSKCPIQEEELIRIQSNLWWGRFIKGWLRREDALKLYELAYFVQGDILELGSYYGLSTTILSEANQHSTKLKHIYSVDWSPKCSMQTRLNLYAKDLYKDTTVFWKEAASAVKSFAKQEQKFEFVFIDHSHAYTPVYEVCQELNNIVVEGGFCLFHDFNDPRNRDEQDHEYGVYQAVASGLDTSQFEFYGIYGCSALYRKRTN